MLKRCLVAIVAFALTVTLFADEWDTADLTDGYGSGSLIDEQFTGGGGGPGGGGGSAQVFRVAIVTLPSDTSTVDATWSGAGTPTGVMVLGTNATSDDTTTAEAMLSCGISDFTTTGNHTGQADDNVATTDTTEEGTDEAIFVALDPGTHARNRTATVSTTTDGVTLTPGESGTQYRLIVIGIFADEFVAFNDIGVGSGLDDDFAHGLTGAPQAGIYCGGATNMDETGASPFRMTVGFHAGTSVIEQAQMSWTIGNGEEDGEAHGILSNSRISSLLNSGNGGVSWNQSITSNNATTITYRCETGGNNCGDGDLVGGLMYIPTNDASVVTSASPGSAGAWNNNDFGFTPGSLIGVLGNLNTIGLDYTDDSEAGTVSIFATDFDTEATASIMDENGADPTDTASRISTELWVGVDDHSEGYACNGLTPDSNGWTATCDTASAGADTWVFLGIEQSVQFELDGDPYISAQDETSYTVAVTTTGAANIYAVACEKDLNDAITIAQVTAGNCADSASALASDNDNIDGASSLSLDVTSSAYPVADIFVTDGTTLVALNNEYLDAASGYYFVDIETLAPDSACVAFNDVEDPDIARPDVLVMPDSILLDSQCRNIGTGSNIVIYDVSAGDFHAETIDFDTTYVFPLLLRRRG